MKAVTITVVDQLEDPVPLVARVALFQDGALVTYQTTDALGVCDFVLEEGTYIARVLLTDGIYEAPRPVSVEVGDEGNDFEITVERTVYPAVADPSICVLGGALRVFSGGEVVIGLLQVGRAGVLNGSSLSLFVPDTYTLRFQPDTPQEVLLPRKFRYSVTSPHMAAWEIVVPDASSAVLQDVLFPLLTGITVETPAVSVAVEETEDVSYSEVYTSGLVIDPAEEDSVIDQDLAEEDETSGITFKSSDDAVMTVSKSDGKIRITGVSPGTATIYAEITQIFDVIGAVEQILDIVSVEVTA
jgi:hypothetical protein